MTQNRAFWLVVLKNNDVLFFEICNFCVCLLGMPSSVFGFSL